jgi:hypothetical protein
MMPNNHANTNIDRRNASVVALHEVVCLSTTGIERGAARNQARYVAKKCARFKKPIRGN